MTKAAAYSGEITRRAAMALAFAAIIVCILVPLLGCRKEKESRTNLEKVHALFMDSKRGFPEVPDLSVNKLIERQQTETIILVDNREAEEQKVSMIPGAITSETFESDIDKYGKDTVVIYCTIGSRSGYYTKKLREQNIDAYNLQGGVLAWAHAGKSFVDKDGSETKRVHVYGSRWNLLPDGYESVW
jgi:rhodanese-related sulfurtransferase